MSPEKKPEFVVTDRRKFTEEGELRTDRNEQVETESQSDQKAHVESEKVSAREARGEGPSEAERHAQEKDYAAGSKRLDDLVQEKTGKSAQMEMTFERLVASLYMTAMLQLGLMAPEGEQPRADILGARQTIDTLALLLEKTKGNLTDPEKNLLQQSLFELRMAFLELTNAIARTPQPSPGGKKK
jgi:hypothetical protein